MSKLALAAIAATTILCAGLSANQAEAMIVGGIQPAIEGLSSVQTAYYYRHHYYGRHYYHHRRCHCWWRYGYRHCRCWY
jgi:hypothetical protein